MIIHLDPTPLLLPTVLKRQPPPALPLRRCQPQPHQMPPRPWRRVVFISCPRVEDVVVAEKLDVPDFENHV